MAKENQLIHRKPLWNHNRVKNKKFGQNKKKSLEI